MFAMVWPGQVESPTCHLRSSFQLSEMTKMPFFGARTASASSVLWADSISRPALSSAIWRFSISAREETWKLSSSSLALVRSASARWAAACFSSHSRCERISRGMFAWARAFSSSPVAF